MEFYPISHTENGAAHDQAEARLQRLHTLERRDAPWMAAPPPAGSVLKDQSPARALMRQIGRRRRLLPAARLSGDRHLAALTVALAAASRTSRPPAPP